MGTHTASPSPLATVRRALVRYRLAAAAVFVCVLAAVGGLAATAKRTYRSHTKLFIRLGRENVTIDPTATLGAGGPAALVAVPTSRESELNSVLEMLKTRDLLGRVADRVGPEVVLGTAPWTPDAPPAADPAAADARYKAVAHLTKMVDAEVVKKSNVIQVSYDGASPEVAQAVVAGVVEEYLTQHARIHRGPGAHRFFTDQTTRARGDLTRAEEALRAAKDETGLVAPDVQRQLLVDRVSRLETEQAGLTSAAAAAEAEVKALKGRLAALPATVVTATTRGLPNPALDAMRAQLYALQLKEVELQSRLPSNSPELTQARRQTAAAAELLAAEGAGRDQVTSGPSKVREEAEVAVLRQEIALTAATARAAAVGAQAAGERERVRRLTGDQVRLAKLQREVDLADANYRRLVESLERSEIDRALDAEKLSNVSVVQPATLDPVAVGPKLLTAAAMGVAFAALGAVGVAVGLELRRPAADRTDPAASARDGLLGADA